MKVILKNQHRRNQNKIIDVAASQIPHLLQVNKFTYGGVTYNISNSHLTFPEKVSSTAESLELMVYTNDIEWELKDDRLP